jgi:hypothetical protein
MELNRIVVAIVLVAASCAPARTQTLAMQVHPEKSTSVLGEPIFLLVELTNFGSQSLQFDDGPCTQSIEPVIPVKHPDSGSLYGCSGAGRGGSCGSSFVELKPGKKLLRRYLLPDGLEPDIAGASDYTLERRITFYTMDGSYSVSGRQEVTENFTIHAVQPDRARLRADYAPLIANLAAVDSQQSNLALSAITQHPQDFLEPVILKLSQETGTMAASITGLKKLGSDRAKQRLGDLTGAGYEEYIRQPATTALAELGDSSYCELMLQLMNLRQGYTSEIAARGAGFLCREKAIPQLASLFSAKESTFPAYQIAYALGNTGSRTAVPILIEQLSTADADSNRAVTDALYTLTHRGTEGSSVDREEWVRWWAFQGKNAQIFDPTQCP